MYSAVVYAHMHRPDANVVSACTVCSPITGFVILPAAAAGYTAEHGVQLVFQHCVITMLLHFLPLYQHTASFAEGGDHPLEPGQALKSGQHCITQSSFACPELQDPEGAHDIEGS